MVDNEQTSRHDTCEHRTSPAKTRVTCSAAQDKQSDPRGHFPSSDRQIPSSYLGCTSLDFLDTRTMSLLTI